MCVPKRKKAIDLCKSKIFRAEWLPLLIEYLSAVQSDIIVQFKSDFATGHNKIVFFKKLLTNDCHVHIVF